MLKWFKKKEETVEEKLINLFQSQIKVTNNLIARIQELKQSENEIREMINAIVKEIMLLKGIAPVEEVLYEKKEK